MKKPNGFTLLQSMVTIVIVMIVALVSVNILNFMTRRTRDESLRVSIFQLFQEARTNADNLNKTITLCLSRDQEKCGGDWNDGVILFVDQRGDGAVDRDDNIISVTRLKQQDGRLFARFYPLHRDYLQFKPGNQDSGDNGTVWYCHTNEHTPVWAIKINRMGMASSELPNKDGVINDAEGNELRC